nr:hypothetical protein CFP56_31223 [Quercus suber]
MLWAIAEFEHQTETARLSSSSPEASAIKANRHRSLLTLKPSVAEAFRHRSEPSLKPVQPSSKPVQLSPKPSDAEYHELKKQRFGEPIRDASAPTITGEAQRRCFISHHRCLSSSTTLQVPLSPMKLNGDASAPTVVDEAHADRDASSRRALATLPVTLRLPLPPATFRLPFALATATVSFFGLSL